MITNILVLTAFQEGSRRALAMAVEVAARFGSQVHVLHVIEGDLVEVISTAMVPAAGDSGVQAPAGTTVPSNLGQHYRPALGPEDVAGGLVARAERQMRAFVAQVDPGIRLSTAVRIGKPHEVISETVLTRHVDFVVMGRSNHGLKEYLLGSIADKVVRTVGCPVCLL
jgi:nucleotide-binding universal stress UspA family protein